MNKYKRLKKIINHKQFNKFTNVINLLRLTEGDLKHIGDAIAEGKEVIHTGSHRIDNIYFSVLAEDYSIKKPTVIINGKELVAPETEAPEVGADFWYISPSPSYKRTWMGNNLNLFFLKSGCVFLTKEDAEAMFEAQRDQRLGK